MHPVLGGNGVRAIIIADDFTGACDTGVRFAAPGEPCPVVVAEDRDTTGGCAGAVELEPAGGGAAAGTPDLTGCDIAGAAGVLVIDTESRHATPDEAASTVRRVAWEIAACDPQIIYKKIDSTLRGNIRAELEVIAATFPERVLVVAPAFPATGRTTRGGRCLVDGVPVDRTEFARDRRSAVRSACIADLVGFAPAIAECSVGELPDVVSRAVPGSAIIVDAERDDELAGIAGIVAGDWRRFLLAGSAGLAGAVAERLRNVSAAPASAAFGDDGMLVSRVVLGLVGSLSERSRRQADVLRKHGEVAVVTVVGDTGDTAAAVVAALRSGRDALVLSPPPSNDSKRRSVNACSWAPSSMQRHASHRRSTSTPFSPPP